MARPRKFERQEFGNTVAGASYHKRSGHYIINPAAKWRESFGYGPEGFCRARPRHRDLTEPGWAPMRKKMRREGDRAVIAARLLDPLSAVVDARGGLVAGLGGAMKHDRIVITL